MSSLREGFVYIKNHYAGVLRETDEGYSFLYDKEYLSLIDATPVSLTLPLNQEEYKSKTLFSFFDGLIPEGWMLDVVVNNWKVSSNDRFSILLLSCADPIGDVSIKAKKI